MFEYNAIDCDQRHIIAYYLKTFDLEYDFEFPYPSYNPDISKHEISDDIVSIASSAVKEICQSTSKDDYLKLRCIEFITTMTNRQGQIEIEPYFDEMAYNLDHRLFQAHVDVSHCISNFLYQFLFVDNIDRNTFQPMPFALKGSDYNYNSFQSIFDIIRKLNDDFKLYSIIVNFVVKAFRPSQSIDVLIASEDRVFMFAEYVNRFGRLLHQACNAISGTLSVKRIFISKNVYLVDKSVCSVIKAYDKLGKVIVKTSLDCL